MCPSTRAVVRRLVRRCCRVAHGGLIPPDAARVLSSLGAVTATVALAAVGLSARLGEIRAAGSHPLLLGGVVWIVVPICALAFIAAF
jgi:uncharacterized membrane protein YadS